MTDMTPDARPPEWATVIGTWIGRVRVFAAQVSVIFRLAPILATGVIGLLAALSIAQWSQKQIAGNSPLAANIPATKTATTSAMGWLADDSAVIFFDGGPQPVSFHPNGEIDSLPAVLPTYANDAAMSALIVQPAEDGVLAVRTNSFEIVTPGGLAAIDGGGLLYVTSGARLRNTDKSNEHAIEGTASSDTDQSVWSTEAAAGPSKRGEPRQFVPALSWGTAVTAMIALPAPGRIAVGGADGGVAFLGDGTPTRSGGRTIAAPKPIGNHGAPVVAFAAAGISGPIGQGGARFASAASDGSIKVWHQLDRGDDLTSRDVLFPRGSALTALAPDSLELSDDGRLLTVRTPAGAIFAARLAGPGGTAAETKGAVSPDTNILTDLRFGQPVTASALSRGSGASLYVAGPDCSIQEVDLANVTGNRTADGFVTRVATLPVKLTLRGHNGPISRLAASHNGRYLAAASLDGRVRIHHLSSLRYLAMLPFTDLPTGPACTSTAAVELPPESDARPESKTRK